MVAVIFNYGNFSSSLHKDKESDKIEKFSQQSMLLGKFSEKDLLKEPYSRWFKPRYENYEPKKSSIKTISKHINDYKITLYMGTWCGDSKRETPRLFKVLEESGFKMKNLTAYAVDHSKRTPEKTEENVNLHRVPTIIFYKNGKEVNRFVEYSQESIEEDIAKIVSGKEYKNPYAK